MDPLTGQETSTPRTSGVPIARADVEAIDRALGRARESLLSLQQEDGHWCGTLEGDSILESEYVMLFEYLGLGGDPRLPKLAQRLRSIQQPEGGWATYPDGTPDVSVSVEAYFALKLCGDSPDAEHMARARQVILELGGMEAVNSFTRFNLAMLGQISWDACPAVPPELVMLPSWSYLNIWSMSSWSRAIVVPLTIVWALRPARSVSEKRSIHELSSGRPPPSPAREGAGLVENGWRQFFHRLDGALKKADGAGAFNLSRRRALQRAERWMTDRLEMSDGLGAIFPSMMYSVVALTALGHGPESLALRQQLHELERLELPCGDGLAVQPCKPPVWDTALAANALAIAGTPSDDPALQRAATWLLAREVRSPGDWQVRTPGQVGGWYFEYANEFYPDCDDTAQVLLALSRTQLSEKRLSDQAAAASRRALSWLLSMQNSDGGWAAFDRDCQRQVLTYVPFADHNAMLDPSCADITGRTLDALSRMGVPEDHPAVRRAVRFLEKAQEPDGSFYGRWGCNYIYGTYLALVGLRAAGYPMASANVAHAASWLRTHQNPDGGWGETYRSYEDPAYKGQGESTAAQTAWALLGLFAAGDRSSRAVRRGLESLVRTQGGDGTWHDKAWTGTGFPRVFYLRYDYYDDYFPLLALAEYRRGEVPERRR